MKPILLCISVFFLTSAVFSQNFVGDQKELKAIMKQAEGFSKSVMKGDTEELVNFYTDDAKIFPSNREILSGADSIRVYWTFPEDGSSISHHKLTPLEIKVIGDEAYDYGYYEGISKAKDGSESSWQGKYVVIWKKVDGVWKMYLDIWNGSPAKEE